MQKQYKKKKMASRGEISRKMGNRVEQILNKGKGEI
jgi:hypothetical protein